MSAEIRAEIQKLSKIQLKQEDFIGQGGHALVYRYKILNAPIALKCFENQEHAQTEMQILQGIQSLIGNCPGIIKCYGMKTVQIQMLDEISMKYVIFLQACEIDLQKKMIMMQKFSIPQIFDLLSQLSLSLLCIHLNNCFHGDIKPANIFINKNNQQLSYYFGDFGEGKITGTYISIDFKTLSLRGTPSYLSPELWRILNERKSAGNYDPLPADVYALGITILQILLPQKFIFDLIATRENQQLYEKEILKIKEEILKIQEFKNNSSNQLLKTILGMVNFDPLKRPSAIEICFEMAQSNQLCMNTLSFNNMQALTTQLIQSLYWQKKQKKELQDELESQKTIIQMLMNQNQQEKNIEQIIPKNLLIPSFSSDIIKNSDHAQIILALFGKTNISLERIHQQLNISEFDYQKFHKNCDFKGATLVIMHSQQEPKSLFGGMAASSWNQERKWIVDPPEECSWLFKIEFTDRKVDLHQWKCIKKQNAIIGGSNGFQFGYEEYAAEGGFAYYKYYKGGGYYKGGYFKSVLEAKNDYYQKVKFNKKTRILVELQKKLSINFPPKALGKIMSEEIFCFQLDALEVFSIKK